MAKLNVRKDFVIQAKIALEQEVLREERFFWNLSAASGQNPGGDKLRDKTKKRKHQKRRRIISSTHIRSSSLAQKGIILGL